jgi:hypothetical protein
MCYNKNIKERKKEVITMANATRQYECRATIRNSIVICNTVSATYDPSTTKIKDLEQEIKEEVARHFTKGSYKFSAEDIKIKKI